MIRNFRHRGLERFFRKGETIGIQAQHAGRIGRMLDALDEASSAEHMNMPGMYLHRLRGGRKGQWAVTVSGNWRITFALDGEDVVIVNLEDYH